MFGASRLGLYAANPISTGVTGGYSLFAGGYTDAPRTSSIRKYDLPTDTASNFAVNLSASRDQVCGFANGTTGVFAGGSTGSAISTVELINLSAETKSSGQALNTNTLATRQGRGTSTSTIGYMLGGITTASVNDIKKYTYSSNVWGYTTNGLGYGAGNAPSSSMVHCNSTKAVNAGGHNDSTSVPVSTVKEFTFNDESTATASYSLNTTTSQGSCSGNQSKWITVGGYLNSSATLTTAAESYTFASGTRTAATALTYGFRTGDAAGDDVRGIIGGGYVTGGGTFSTVTNWIYTYSTDTYANPSSYLYTAKNDLPAAFHSLQVS